MAKHNKHQTRTQTPEERADERRLLKLILKHTVGSQPQTRPPEHVRVKVGSGRGAVVVEFRSWPPAAAPGRRVRYMKSYPSLYRPAPWDIRRQLGEFDD